MFFVKVGNAETPVEDLKIFSKCPICGKVDEITDEFWGLISEPESNFDIYGSNLYCENCSAESDRIRSALENHMSESELDSVLFRVMEAAHGISAD